jgi:hypothetical protein
VVQAQRAERPLVALEVDRELAQLRHGGRQGEIVERVALDPDVVALAEPQVVEDRGQRGDVVVGQVDLLQ